MNNRRSLILLIFISICVVICSLYNDILISSFLCAKWHISNDNVINIGKAEINLPYLWWATSKEKEQIIINRIPPCGCEFFGQIIVFEKSLTKNDLIMFKKERTINGTKLTKRGSVETIPIDDEIAYVIEYTIDSPREKKDRVYWTWTIPSQYLLINAIEIPIAYKKKVLSEIIKNIRFPKRAR